MSTSFVTAGRAALRPEGIREVMFCVLYLLLFLQVGVERLHVI
jgi:hypothetical protein